MNHRVLILLLDPSASQRVPRWLEREMLAYCLWACFLFTVLSHSQATWVTSATGEKDVTFLRNLSLTYPSNTRILLKPRGSFLIRRGQSSTHEKNWERGLGSGPPLLVSLSGKQLLFISLNARTHKGMILRSSDPEPCEFLRGLVSS